MECRVHEWDSLKNYKYVIIFSFYQERLLLSRHRQRTTWETQGGHVEPGETVWEAARRELYEESGALSFDLHPLCDCWAGDAKGGATGAVFVAEIRQLGVLPEYEMAETGLFCGLPDHLTYPAITPTLFAHLLPPIELIYGTYNLGKLQWMRQKLAGLPIEIKGLTELNATVMEVEEKGRSPLDNARQKAETYSRILQKPVFSCDSGLYLEGVPQEQQPGIHVRRVGDRRLGDEEMVDWYAALARAHGGRITARYCDAVYLVTQDGQRDWAIIEEKAFYLVDTPCDERCTGLPLDSLSVDPETGRYFAQKGQESGSEPEAVGDSPETVGPEPEDDFVVFFWSYLLKVRRGKGNRRT